MNNIALVFLSILTIITPKIVTVPQLHTTSSTVSLTSISQLNLTPNEFIAVQLQEQHLQAIVIKIATPAVPVLSTKSAVTLYSTLPKSTQPLNGIREYARQVVTDEFGSDQFAAFDKIIMMESSWNPLAVNSSSGACGLAQALPCSKYTDASPTGQIKWATTYIRERYGNPNKALAFHKINGWY